MRQILIADDEEIIRQGMKFLLDYDALGYTICGEAATGDEALEKLCTLRPDVALLDIRMPGLTGLEVVRQARQRGFRGKVVIVSSYTDFKYAQEAIRYGVQDYITKPIDDEELTDILKRFQEEFAGAVAAPLSPAPQATRMDAVGALLRGAPLPAGVSLSALGLNEECFQVVLLRCPKEDHEKWITPAMGDELVTEDEHVLLLRGRTAMDNLDKRVNFYIQSHAAAPEEIPFFAFGREVDSIREIPDSYASAQTLLQRQFFCDEGIFRLSYGELPPEGANISAGELVARYAATLLDCIQSFNRRRMEQVLDALRRELTSSREAPDSVRLLLTDLYLQVRQQMHHLYPDSEIPFFSNAAIISTIQESRCLGDILKFFRQRFDTFIDSIGISTRDSVLDDVLHYIHHNYAGNITLENIAPLFGYNRSYLGKIFTKKMGQNFNSYVDYVRIEKSKELLLNDDMKVYTIAERVGYKNVDYFHIKFRKYVGQSPAEFRKKNKGNAE